MQRFPRDVRISIHVPRVEDDLPPWWRERTEPISIHVPRVEDDKGGLES